jgi:3-oxoacyl-[acyl-carrier-protein] synthase II
VTSPKKVFVTGYGSVSCLDGDPELHTIPDFDPAAFISAGAARRMDRFTLLAYVAVKKALEQARFEIRPEHRERVGLVFNTCYGPFDSTRHYLMKLIRDGARKAPAAVFPNTVHNAFTGLITIDLKALGTSSTVSGCNPICYGLDMIREGRDDAMIVGGCDELIAAIGAGFELAGYPAPRAADAGGSRASVVDPERNAFALGEGAAVLVLESEDFARARGATPLAEVLDYGNTNGPSGSREVFPTDRECIEVAMRQALRRSGIEAAAVDLLSLAANGLPDLARDEREAIDGLFGPGTRPWASAGKGSLGETLAAASSFSTILAVSALAGGGVPATQGLAPGCLPLRYVAGETVAGAVDLALVNSVELGGNVTSLALRRIAA